MTRIVHSCRGALRAWLALGAGIGWLSGASAVGGESGDDSATNTLESVRREVAELKRPDAPTRPTSLADALPLGTPAVSAGAPSPSLTPRIATREQLRREEAARLAQRDWLVRAMLGGSSETGATRAESAVGELDLLAAFRLPTDAAATASTVDRSALSTSFPRASAPNPLDDYMDTWLSPTDRALLTAPTPNHPIGTADGLSLSAMERSVAPPSPSRNSLAPQNPFLDLAPAPARSADILHDFGVAPPVSAPPIHRGAVEPAAPPPPRAVPAPAPNSADEKYFPQLKRF